MSIIVNIQTRLPLVGDGSSVKDSLRLRTTGTIHDNDATDITTTFEGLCGELLCRNQFTYLHRV